MKKGLLVLLFVLISMTAYATEANEYFGQFINKPVEVEYSNRAGKTATWKAKGILESVSEYGIIIKTNKELIS